MIVFCCVDSMNFTDGFFFFWFLIFFFTLDTDIFSLFFLHVHSDSSQNDDRVFNFSRRFHSKHSDSYYFKFKTKINVLFFQIYVQDHRWMLPMFELRMNVEITDSPGIKVNKVYYVIFGKFFIFFLFQLFISHQQIPMKTFYRFHHHDPESMKTPRITMSMLLVWMIIMYKWLLAQQTTFNL